MDSCRHEENDHADVECFRSSLNALNQEYQHQEDFLSAVLLPYTHIFTHQNISLGEKFKNKLELELIGFIHENDKELNYFLIHKNISHILKLKTSNIWPAELEPDAFAIYLKWLQFNFCLQSILHASIYRQSITELKQLAQRQNTRSSFTKFFQYSRAILNGIGIANVLLGWAPMAIIGLLGFFGVILSPLLITLLSSVFCLASLGLGGLLIRTFLKKYQREDTSVLEDLQKTQNKISYFAIREAQYKKNIYRLQHEYILLCEKLKQPPQALLIQAENQNVETTTLIHQKFKFVMKETSLWLDPLTSFFGSVGTVWGLPATILGIFGISLLIGTSFSVAGLLLAAGALLFSTGFALSTFFFTKNSLQTRHIYQAIKSNVASFKNNLELNRVKSNELEHEIATLKIQLNEQTLAKQDAEVAHALKKEINAIEADAHPKLTKINESTSKENEQLSSFGNLKFFDKNLSSNGNHERQSNPEPNRRTPIKTFA